MSNLLPPNSTFLEHALTNTPDLDRLVPEIIASLWNPYACPAPLLPWLAWALSVDEWDESWDESTQRNVIASSIEIHRMKGTVWAVEKALSSLGHTGKLTEWWQTNPRGVPHTFIAEVEIDSRGIDEPTIASIERSIFAVKPVRSHFSTRLVAKTTCRPCIGIGTLSGDVIVLYPHQITELDPAPPALFTAIGTHEYGTTTVYPQ